VKGSLKDKEKMDFDEIFACFIEHNNKLKVVYVASCDENKKPNAAPKMLVDIVAPNKVFFLDYRFTQTHANMTKNKQLSISFMNEAAFQGYRLNGTCEFVQSGEEYEAAKKQWDKRITRYEAARIVERVTGHYSAREAEMVMPKNFAIVKFTAHEGSVVKPDRVLRAKE